MNLILASSSPHRAEILKQHKIDFVAHSPNIDEEKFQGGTAEEIAIELARQKCRAIYTKETNGGNIVLAADTIVIDARGEMLNKPRDEEQARNYMRNRSNSNEVLITGFCIKHSKGKILGAETTQIDYDTIPQKIQEEILSSKEWQGVCGGLKVEGIIAPYVRKVEGDYDNIRGLPMNRILPLLNSMSIEARPADKRKGD